MSKAIVGIFQITICPVAFRTPLGNETGRPTLILDVGSLMGSLVGQSEERTRHALRIADAMAPCVLMVDEIDKALAGIAGSGQTVRTSPADN